MSTDQPQQPRRRTNPIVVFVSSAAVLIIVGIAWRISDLKYAGLPLDHWYRNKEIALFLLPTAVALLVTLGVHLADNKLAKISSVRPDTGHASQIPELIQAAAVAFIGSMFAGTASLANAILGVESADRWMAPLLLAVPELVVMYYFANRFIDIDMLRPDVRPWFLSAMLALGSAGLATAKFYSSQPSMSGRNTGANITVPLLILAFFAWIGMSVKRPDEP